MSELIDNRRIRIEKLKEIIQGLHAGQQPAEVREKLAALIGETTGEEVVEMEQQLMHEGMSAEEIKSMCDLHAQITGELVAERAEAQPGHPVDTFRRENKEIGRIALRMRSTLTELQQLDAAGRSALFSLLERWRAETDQLLEVEKHYARKENLLFPYLERHGVTGPSQVMWGKDDDIRALLKGLREALLVQEADLEEWGFVATQIAEPLLEQVELMIDKEEMILLPMSLAKLDEQEWGAIYRESPRFGYCLVTPGEGYVPPPVTLDRDQADTGAIRFPAGSLSATQIRALVRTLPFDLTFVDHDDRVAFFSEGKDRIFSRTPAVIGRKVQNCHPPASVETVEQILADFRAGRQSVAEFWITLGERFVHIRYFAVRDGDDAYLGTLEVTQDLTPLRKLTGERRLLQYEDGA